MQPERAVKSWRPLSPRLGVHLYDERESWAEYIAGHKLMQTAATNLMRLIIEKNNEAAKAEKIQTFIDAEQAQSDEVV